MTASLLSTSIDVPAWVAIVGTVLGIVAMIAAAVAIARQVAIKESLATIIDANEELRKTNADLRAEHAIDREKWARELAVEREKRAQLEGRLDAVTSHLADQIVTAVAAAVARQHPST